MFLFLEFLIIWFLWGCQYFQHKFLEGTLKHLYYGQKHQKICYNFFLYTFFLEISLGFVYIITICYPRDPLCFELESLFPRPDIFIFIDLVNSFEWNMFFSSFPRNNSEKTKFWKSFIIENVLSSITFDSWLGLVWKCVGNTLFFTNLKLFFHCFLTSNVLAKISLAVLIPNALHVLFNVFLEVFKFPRWH